MASGIETGVTMERTFRAISLFVIGAIVGVVGLTLFLSLLFWMLNPTDMSRTYEAGYSMIILLFTVPIGGTLGGILSLAWFFEGSF